MGQERHHHRRRRPGSALIADLTEHDIQQAIDAAKAVGDDRIQQRSGGRVNPEQWTHGSAAERVKWFRTGYTQGSSTPATRSRPASL